MRYKTDLDAVKHVAVSLLHTHINETKFSPMVVQHPFTSSGFVGINSNGEMELLNILESAESKNKWQEFMERQITNATNAYQIYMMVNKPYGLTFLSLSEHHMSQEDFSQILGVAWIRSENPNLDKNFAKRNLVAMFKKADKSFLMDSEERDQLEELDDVVTVYRGVTSYNAKNIKALSWTTDYQTADWFAHRFDEDGTVYEAQISKEHILAFFNGRNESEVIVDPKYLMDITEAQAMDTGMTLS